MSTQIDVTLQRDELLLDIRNKSQQELADVADVRQQYHSVAGTDKDEDISRSLTEAVALLMSLCHEYIVAEEEEGTGVDDTPATEDIEISLVLSDRKDGRLLQLVFAADMHGFVVERTLEFYYCSTPARALATVHAARAKVYEDELLRLMYRKGKPVYSD